MKKTSKRNRQNVHVFTVTVKGWRTKRAAELAVLTAFAVRQPDGCEFHLRRRK